MEARTLKSGLAAIIAGGIGYFGGRSFAYRWEDAYWYYKMSNGLSSEVIQPYGGRPLSPLLVRFFHALTHVELNHSFEIVGIFCFLLFVTGIFVMVSRTGVSPEILLAVSLSCFWCITYSNYMLPDLLNDLLLLGFIYLLMKNRLLWAALMLIPLSISRESSALIAVCFGLAAWKTVKSRILVCAAVSLVVGMEMAKRIAGVTLQNRHHLGSIAYMALKVPFNFAKNLLGVTPWSNTLNKCTPVYSRSVPHIGAITRVGVCSFSPVAPSTVLSGWLCEFGLLSLLAILILPRWRRWRDQPLYVRFCLVYGTACFLLAPLLGAAIDRLISYSWPLFLIAVPILFGQSFRTNRTFYVSISLAVLASALFFTGEVRFSEPLMLASVGVSILTLLSLKLSVSRRME